MSLSPAQATSILNRLTALDGITSAVPSAAAVPVIKTDLNGIHTTLSQLTLTIQSIMNTIAQQLATLQIAVNEILGASGLSQPQYTVATLPIGIEGQTAYATDGRKVGESTGHGTGVPVYFSNTLWRVYSTDSAVQS